jgi:hypothetical protein
MLHFLSFRVDWYNIALVSAYAESKCLEMVVSGMEIYEFCDIFGL